MQLIYGGCRPDAGFWETIFTTGCMPMEVKYFLTEILKKSMGVAF